MNFKILKVTVSTFALTVLALACRSRADSVTVVSDGSTLAAIVPSGPQFDAGDITGLTFTPADVGNFGTGTAPPPSSPAGTLVINIPPDDGETGFFMVTFDLPAGFINPFLSGAGNVDDVGIVFLNGTAIGSLDEFNNNTFSTNDSSLFVEGTNTLVVSDDNSGGGPSGAAFFATIDYTATPEPASLTAALIAPALLLTKRRRKCC